jgi:hypothetical protein
LHAISPSLLLCPPFHRQSTVGAVQEKPTLGWEGTWFKYTSPDDRLDLHIYKQPGIYTVTPFHSNSHKEWAYIYLSAEVVENLSFMQDPEQLSAQKPEGAKPTKSHKGGGARRVTVQISAEQKQAQEQSAMQKKWEALAKWLDARLHLTSPQEQAAYDQANTCGDNDEKQPWHFHCGVKFKKTPSDPADAIYQTDHPEENQIDGPERKQMHANHREMFQRKSNAVSLQTEVMKAEIKSAKNHLNGVGMAYKVFSDLLGGTDNSAKGRAIRGLAAWARKTLKEYK